MLHIAQLRKRYYYETHETRETQIYRYTNGFNGNSGYYRSHLVFSYAFSRHCTELIWLRQNAYNTEKLKLNRATYSTIKKEVKI